MHLDELKTAWTEFNRSLQSARTINEKIVTSMIKDRSRSRLTHFRREYIFFFLLMVVWVIVFSAVLAGNPFDFTYTIQYIPTVLFLVWSVISCIRLIKIHAIFTTDIDQPDLSHTLKNLVTLYEKHNRSASQLVLIMMAAGLLFSLSFLPPKIAIKGLWPALSESLILMAACSVVYFTAFKLGVFKDRYGYKFRNDLQELEALRAMMKELEGK